MQTDKKFLCVIYIVLKFVILEKNHKRLNRHKLNFQTKGALSIYITPTSTSLYVTMYVEVIIHV